MKLATVSLTALSILLSGAALSDEEPRMLAVDDATALIQQRLSGSETGVLMRQVLEKMFAENDCELNSSELQAEYNRFEEKVAGPPVLSTEQIVFTSNMTKEENAEMKSRLAARKGQTDAILLQMKLKVHFHSVFENMIAENVIQDTRRGDNSFRSNGKGCS